MIIDNPYSRRCDSFTLLYGKYCLWLTFRNPFRYFNFGLDIHFARPMIVVNIWIFEMKFYRDRFYKK